VLDATTGGFGQRVADGLAVARRDTAADSPLLYRVERVEAGDRLEAVRDSLLASVDARDDTTRRLAGVLVVTDSSLETGRVTYLGGNVGSPGEMRRLRERLQPILVVSRLHQAGVDPAVALPAMTRVDLVTGKVTAGRLTGESGEASFLLAYLMAFLLYFALIIYGMQVMMSTIEEKTNRISEVMVSSLTPFQMMTGKVLGVGAVGLLQLGIWAGTATVLTGYRAELAVALGAPAEATAGLPIPAISPALLAVFLLCYLLGFLLYAALYAAVGAMCNAVQEAQQAGTPVTLLVAAGLLTMFSLLSEPAGTLAQTLSFIPFFAPFVLPIRYSLSAIAPLELVVALLLLRDRVTGLAPRSPHPARGRTPAGSPERQAAIHGIART
jgi:ABC-2 type transport system permease protein